MASFSGYTFSSNDQYMLGNAIVGKFNAGDRIESELPIVVVTEPQHALRYMGKDDKLIKCFINSPVSVMRTSSELLIPGMGARGRGGKGAPAIPAPDNDEFLELTTRNLLLEEQLSVEEYIHTPEFCNWLLRNRVENADFIRVCFANFSAYERIVFIKTFPLEYIRPHVKRFTNGELEILFRAHPSDFTDMVRSGDVVLPSDPSDFILERFACVYPELYLDHEKVGVREAAQIVLAEREPLAHIYFPNETVRRAAYLKAFEVHGAEFLASRIDFSKETSAHNRRMMLNKFSCQHFINDPDRELRTKARELRDTWFDRLWLKWRS